MTTGARAARLFLLLLLTFSFIGCSQFRRGTLSDEKDPHFIEGKKRTASLDWDGAIESFERALQSNPANAAAHFELGVLYDQKKNNFAAAVYHYQKHLQLRPDSPMADLTKTYVIACKRELAKEVSYALVPRDVQRDLERFNQTNALLRQQIDMLRAELARRPQYITNYITNLVQMPHFEPGRSSRLTEPATIVQQQPVAAFVEPDPEPETRPVTPVARTASQTRQTANNSTTANNRRPSAARAAEPKSSARRYHTVRPGDTLAVVASKYGVSVAALKAANPSARNGARAGQRLVIPDK